MIKRLLFVTLAVILAWYLGPLLTGALSFLPIKEFINLLMPSEVTEQSFTVYLTALIWAIVFYFLFQAFGVPLGFLWPSFSRYSCTKVMRRTQGRLFEFLMLGVLFLGLILGYHAINFEKRELIEDEVDALGSSGIAVNPMEFLLDLGVGEILSEHRNRFFLAQHDDLYRELDSTYRMPVAMSILTIKPKRLGDPRLAYPSSEFLTDLSEITKANPDEIISLFFEDIDILKNHADFREVAPRNTSGLAGIAWKDLSGQKEKRANEIVEALLHDELKLIRSPPSIYTLDKKDSAVLLQQQETPVFRSLHELQVSGFTDSQPKRKERPRPAQEKWIEDEILRTVKEQIAFEKNALKSLNDVLQLRLTAMRTEKANDARDSRIQELLQEFENQNPILRAIAGILYSARKTWLILLPFAVLILIIAHRYLRKGISNLYSRLIRFIEESRLGKGGAGRFAGAIEEWGLLLNYRVPGATIGMIPGLGFLLGLLMSFITKQLGIRRFGDFLQMGFQAEPDLSSSALFVGRSLYNPFLNIALRDDRHMLTIAGSRSGKGVSAIIPNLLLWEGSAIVIDPKGTNAAVTARRRQEMGQSVHLVDPFGIVEKDPGKRASFNPLEGLDPESDTIREMIGSIVEALVVIEPSQKDKHWDEGAKTVLTGLIGQIISDPQYSRHAHLGMIRDILSMNPEEQTELWADMSFNNSAGNTAREAASRIIRGIGTDEMLSIFSNADKHTEWLSSKAMQQTLSKSTFSFSLLKERPTTIYLILPPHFLETHKRFLRLFVNITISQMSMGGRSKVPVMMILDEFLALGYMSEVEKAFGLMAGYNLIMWPFVQDYGRLKDIYQNSVNSFVTNSRAVQVFGISDEQSTEFVSKSIGNHSVEDKKSPKRSIPLRSPSEVALDVSADSGRQYILRAGKAPLLLERSPYFSSDLLLGNYPGPFKGKFDVDPDYKK